MIPIIIYYTYPVFDEILPVAVIEALSSIHYVSYWYFYNKEYYFETKKFFYTSPSLS